MIVKGKIESLFQMGCRSISNQKSDDEIRIMRTVKEIKMAKSDCEHLAIWLISVADAESFELDGKSYRVTTP